MKRRRLAAKLRLNKKTILWYTYLIILTPICFELALRIVGAKPYIQQHYSIQSTPENAYIGHDSLGIALKPGGYHITHNKKHSFHTTHTLDQRRQVSHFKGIDSISRTSLVFFGCSFTYGYGVNDEEHYVSLLQKAYPNAMMSNYGVIGYGTIQSLLQLEKMEQLDQLPDKVVLAFATDHFERNALTHQYRRALKIGFNHSLETAKVSMKDARFPYLDQPNANIAFEKWDALYKDWAGRDRFAAINWIQTTRDKILDQQRDIVGISSKLIHSMYHICRKNDLEFLIVLLDENERSIILKKQLAVSKIPFVEVNFNFESATYTNLPYDMHPNAKGHAYIAEKMMPAFKTLMLSD